MIVNRSKVVNEGLCGTVIFEYRHDKAMWNPWGYLKKTISG